MPTSDGHSSPVRVPKMAEVIADRLRRSIVRGELAEGEALPSEAEFMAPFQVSRPTLREALRVLGSESLTHVRRGARGGARAQVPQAAVVARYAGLVLQFRGVTLDDLYGARPDLDGLSRPGRAARPAGGELSGGQQQMLNIASAIVARPTVLLVDEPSSGLSPMAVEQVLGVIDRLRADGLAILLVEQVIEDVLGGFADDVVLIDQGRVLLREDAEDVSFDLVSTTMFGPGAVT